jgi:hypothetical protein
MRRISVLGLLFIPIIVSAELPQWQQVRLIGKVEPIATAEGLTLGPGSGFGCMMKDETKPVKNQYSPYNCGEFSTEIFLSDGKKIYPPVSATGTVAAGLITTWSDWAESIEGWGSNLKNLKPSEDGTVTAKLYSSPLEGGCKPAMVNDKPSRDRKGERCLAPHGEVTFQLGPAALLALTKQVGGLESGDDTACSPSIIGCGNLAALRVVATCNACAGGGCDEAECKKVHDRAALVVQGQVAKAGWAIVKDEAESSRPGYQVTGLIKLITSKDELLAIQDRASLKSALGAALARSFNRHLAGGDTDAAGMAVRHLQDLQGETGANVNRRAKLKAKRDAKKPASSSPSRKRSGASYWRSRPLSDRLLCLRKCPNCMGDDILDYGGDQRACLSAEKDCAASCGCTNSMANTPAEWCE